MDRQSSPLGLEGQITSCTAHDCLYNDESQCIARDVSITYHKTHADCNTYTQNRHVPGLIYEELVHSAKDAFVDG